MDDGGKPNNDLNQILEDVQKISLTPFLAIRDVKKLKQASRGSKQTHKESKGLLCEKGERILAEIKRDPANVEQVYSASDELKNYYYLMKAVIESTLYGLDSDLLQKIMICCTLSNLTENREFILNVLGDAVIKLFRSPGMKNEYKRKYTMSILKVLLRSDIDKGPYYNPRTSQIEKILRSNFEFMKEIIESYRFGFAFADPDLKTHPELYLAAITKENGMLDFEMHRRSDMTGRQRKEALLNLLNPDTFPKSMSISDENLKAIFENYLTLISKYPTLYRTQTNNHDIISRIDRELALAVLRRFPHSYLYKTNLKNDQDFMIDLLHSHGLNKDNTQIFLTEILCEALKTSPKFINALLSLRDSKLIGTEKLANSDRSWEYIFKELRKLEDVVKLEDSEKWHSKGCLPGCGGFNDWNSLFNYLTCGYSASLN